MATNNPLLKKYKFRKLKRIKDPRTGTFVDVIKFPCQAGGVERIMFKPSELLAVDRAIQKLADHDAVLPSAHSERKALIRALSDAAPRQRAVYVDGAGWINDTKQFVFQRQVVGPPLAAEQIPREVSTGDPRCQLSQRGTMEAWRDSVGRYAQRSSLMMCICGAAFGAPLLELLSMEGFGLCIYGQSKSGKSLTTLVAASIIGIPQLPNWSVTKNWLGENLPAFKDQLFPIDELANLRADGKIRDSITQLAYFLAGGMDTARHSSFAAVQTSLSSNRWRTICVTQFERAVAELGITGAFRTMGEALRMIDLPALLRGCSDVFDRAPSLTPAKRIEWRQSVIASIVAGCEQNQGKTFVSYLHALLASRPKSTSRAREYQAEFIAEVAKTDDDDATRDLARRFGVLYAGNQLAREFNVVDWQSSDILNTAVVCYRAACGVLPTERNRRRISWQKLRHALKALPKEAEINWDQVTHQTGYQVAKSGKGRIYMIGVDAFRRVVGEDNKAILQKWLISEGRLTLMNGKAAVPKQQHSWPDGKRHRSYRILL